MSYQERRAIISLISTILITVVYSAYMMQRYPESGSYSVDVFRFWGAFFLILIPVSILAKIIIHIMFSIIHTIATNEAEPNIMDERDRFIELKAGRNSLYVFSAGVMLAMASLVIDMPPAIMFIILFCSGLVSEMVSEMSKFYFYRRGF
jgi:hypothetical protein